DAAAVGAEERSMRVTKARLGRIKDLLRPQEGVTPLRHWLAVTPKLASKAKNWLQYTIGSRLERIRNTRKVSELRSEAAATKSSGSDLPFLQLYEVAHRQHEPNATLSNGEVVLFRATQGNGEPNDVPFQEIYADDLLGWQCHAQPPIRAIDVPGGHSSALQEPNVGELAKHMLTHMRSALIRFAKQG